MSAKKSVVKSARRKSPGKVTTGEVPPVMIPAEVVGRTKAGTGSLPKAPDKAPVKAPVKAAGKAAPKAGLGRVLPETGAVVKRRFWLTYPPKRIQTAVIWELGHRFPVMTNIRQASVTDEVGIVCLEVDGPGDEVEAGIRWLKRLGLSVEPVELSAVAS
jgi:hypothetical protein